MIRERDVYWQYGPIVYGDTGALRRSDRYVRCWRNRTKALAVKREHAARVTSGLRTLLALATLTILLVILLFAVGLVYMFAFEALVVGGGFIGFWVLVYLLGYIREGLPEDIEQWT